MLRTQNFKNNVARRPPLHWLLLPLLISIAAADTEKVQPPPAASTKTLQAYHNRLFSGSLTKVSVGKVRVRIEGHMGIILNELFLADIPMDLIVGDPHSWQTLVPARSGSDGRFKVDVPRHRRPKPALRQELEIELVDVLLGENKWLAEDDVVAADALDAELARAEFLCPGNQLALRDGGTGHDRQVA